MEMVDVCRTHIAAPVCAHHLGTHRHCTRQPRPHHGMEWKHLHPSIQKALKKNVRLVCGLLGEGGSIAEGEGSREKGQ